VRPTDLTAAARDVLTFIPGTEFPLAVYGRSATRGCGPEVLAETRKNVFDIPAPKPQPRASVLRRPALRA
jgi:hypothetical protein